MSSHSSNKVLPEESSMRLKGNTEVPEKVVDRPIKLSWKDLTYTVKMKYKKSEREKLGTEETHYDKQILKPQTGYVNSGETLFIMGSSGAGKTSLLNALCDRVTQNSKCKVGGEIRINDTFPVDLDTFGTYGAYVMQDDVLFPTLTCEETIRFSARLRLNLKGEELDRKVDQVIEDLALRKCRNTYIGTQNIKGLSGGERKRAAIGVELIANPSVLFLDEPTSGLDSFTAHKIVKLMVDQSRLGRTIVATIHQPSSDTFALFDRLLLLMDGYTIYQGPAAESSDYFTKLGFEIPMFMNPTDYFLKEFFIPFNKTEEDEQKLEKLTSSYDNDVLPRVIEANEEIKHEEIDDEYLQGIVTSAGFFVALWELTIRTIKSLYRDTASSMIRVMQALVMAILVNLTFWDLGTSTQDQNNKSGLMMFVSITQSFGPFYAVLLVFLVERPVFLREYASKTYGALGYFLSKTLIEMPFTMFFPVIFCVLIYFSTGLSDDADRFFLFIGITLSLGLFATSLGFFFGTVSDEPSVATNIATVAFLPMLLFCGFFVNVDDIPIYLRWAQYISFHRYSLEAYIRNEFEDNSRYTTATLPYDRYNYDVGLAECIIILTVYGIVVRIGALIMLKIQAGRFQ